MPFQQMTCYLHHLLRVHCGVHCACTVRALSKHTRSACSSLLLFHWLLEHPHGPWCCAVLAAAVCLLVSLCARSWNTFVSLGVLPLLAPWRACLPAVGTPLWALVLCWLNSANAYAAKKSLQHKPLSANLPGVLLQKSCRLVFWLSCSVAWNACRMCMYACLHVWMDVCMYVCTHVLFEM